MLKQTLVALAVVALAPLASAQNTEKKVVTSYLSVTHHGEGKSFPDTPRGAYSCAFDKSKYMLNEAGLVTGQLLNSTDARFEIVSLSIANDTKSEYAQRAITSRTASFYGANLSKQSIYFTVFVRDLVNGQIVACDPEVCNVPT
jgi:hypothetical protein